MVYTTQHLSPKIFPFLTFTFPLITILQFSGEHKLVNYQSFLHLNQMMCLYSQGACIGLAKRTWVEATVICKLAFGVIAWARLQQCLHKQELGLTIGGASKQV